MYEMQLRPPHIRSSFSCQLGEPDLASRHRGFALIVTVSLLVLLAVVAIGLLTLSTVITRSIRQDDAIQLAQSNARMALTLAIGELQASMGPDQRVSAEASILDSGSSASENHLMGVWRSWEGIDLVGGAGDYDDKDERFLRWMVSHPDRQLLEKMDFANSGGDTGSDPVYLVDRGSVRNDSNRARAWKVPIRNGGTSSTGSHAWLVTGENTKARINLPRRALTGGSDGSPTELQSEIAAASTPDLRVLGGAMATFPTGGEPAVKAITTNTLPLASEDIAPENIREHWFDFTTWSTGLLADANHGGLKQDLSLMMEGELPSHLSDQWLTPEGVKWSYLRDFYRIYKTNTYPGGSSFNTNHFIAENSGWGGAKGQASEQVRRSPVVARIQWLFATSSIRDSADRRRFFPALVFCPVVTLWNPYNTTIDDIRQLAIKVNVQGFPFQFKFEGAVTEDWHRELESFTVQLLGEDANSWDEPFAMKPGETIVFSPEELIDGVNNIKVYPGYRPYKGYRQKVGNSLILGRNSFAAGLRAAEGEETRRRYLANNFLIRGSIKSIFHFNLSNVKELRDRLITVEPSRQRSLSSIYRKPGVFASVDFHLKTARDNAFPVIGSVHANPLQIRVDAAPNDTEDDPVHNPASNPHDLIIYEHASWTDTLLPNIDPENHGFVASGALADTGVPYAVICELPTRPMQSLVEYQHADLHGPGSPAPYTFNAMGNSIAPPVLPANFIRDMDGKVRDDSFLVNELMFDRYFFSSIAPRDAKWSGNPSESLETVYEAHQNRRRRLPNSRYVPFGDVSKDDTKGSNAYSRIAGKLMVEGMFNVNSTSVEAWAMVLASLNKAKMIHFDPYSDSMEVREQSGGSEFVVRRFTIPAGGSADRDQPAPGQIPEELYWRGYRTLTQDQIRTLAEKIVEQVRLRGPFLSLAEFVNRRPTRNNPDLANRGALAAALEDRSVDINEELKNFSDEITSDIVDGYQYSNPEAGQGHSAYGAPGWVTQADILRPLAPYITVRDDTYKIRAYGETLDSNGKILARAWCEAIVRRTPDYVDPTANPPYEGPVNPDGKRNSAFEMDGINGRFGRRMRLVSFRWLAADEV